VGRTWDAATYERLADWQGREGLALVEQLGLRGDETVLDAGCGTGRLTRHLVERLPRGRVIAVDVSPAMLDEARRRVDPSRVELVLADLAELVLERPVDAIVSGAALHWVLDQDRLFARLHAALRPGGRLLAWSGGAGSHAELYTVADERSRTEPYAAYFDGWTNPIVFATAEETVQPAPRR
jgi:trans-aconitate methyltransferase